jgi:hypothetical protein
MIRVKGVYDGKNVKLLEKISVAPNTTVEVLILEEEIDSESVYQQRLAELGLIRQLAIPTNKLASYQPVPVTGEPVSEVCFEAS